MSPRRRRTPKGRRAAKSVVVPGARAHLIDAEHEYSVDPRTTPPTLDREVLDPLEAGAAVECDAWELPDAAWKDFGGMYARVSVAADDAVTLVEGVDGPLALPEEETE
jgi:hypothetical protein